MIILYLLPFFFTYIFPLFFLAEQTERSTPIFATVLLAVGTILWLVLSGLITTFITGPRKQMRKHKRIQATGKPVRAQVLSYEVTGETQGMPNLDVIIGFVNLVGSQVKAKLSLVDSKPHERRFQPGGYMDLRLNQENFEPALTGAEADYDLKPRIWAWIWLFFNIAYAIGLFLVSYKLHSNGYGWRFLTPASPWLLAPFLGIFLLLFLTRLIGKGDNLVHSAYYFASTKSMKEFGEILLYGHVARGEITSYSQTGTYINEQPQIRFSVKFHPHSGYEEHRTFKQVIPLIELHGLKNAEVEILHLPHKKNVFLLDYVN